MSLLDKDAHKDTIEQIECLIQLWKKIHKRIHMPKSIEKSDFAESFNTIKAVTLRTEFLERYEFPYSADIFDTMDNLFSRLTHTDKSLEWSFLFRDIVTETEMFENVKSTSDKLNALTVLVMGSPDVTKFYVVCFMLLLAMEGVYDEVIRFVYSTEQIVDGQTTFSADVLKYTRIEKIKSRIRITPKAIFDLWDNGHRVRNAIAHARFYYNENDNKMRLVDVNPHDPTDIYTVSLVFEEVHDLVRSIGVISAAFRDLFILLEIYTSLITPPEKHYRFT